MSSFSCCSPDALRSFLPDTPEKKKKQKHHKVVVIHCAHFPNPNPNPNPNSSNPIPSFPAADDWCRRPPAAELSPLSAADSLPLFSFDGSCVQRPKEKLMHIEHALRDDEDGRDGVIPVYAMLPPDAVSPASGLVKRPKAMNASMRAVQMAGVKGVVIDVWWGIVERERPRSYNWRGYKELLDMAKRWGLKVQAILCFHQSESPVGGDHCSIPLPTWVCEEMEHHPDIVYTNKQGMRSFDYISLGCDTLPILQGRSPVQVYADFMRAFRDEFKEYLGEVIVEIQVGLGPGGELRYPSCWDTNHTSEFPGFKEFMCFDKYMYGSLQACVEGIGEVVGDSMDQCHFKGTLDDVTKEAAANRQALFLEWYSEQLLWHGERILESAKAIFWGTGTKLSAKVPKALDCHCKDISLSHPAQMLVVSGCLYNDGYLRVMRMFGRHGITLNFTCSETSSANVAPQPAGVFQQMTLKAAFQAHNGDSTRCSQDRIIMPKPMERSKHCGYGSLLCSLILIRMTRQLFLSDAWHAFVKFLEDRSRRVFSSSQHVSMPFLQQQSSM